MMKRKIAITTIARSDYGLLRGLMHEVKRDRQLILQTVVGGMHLEKHFGLTYKAILQDGFKIDAKVPMNLTSDLDYKIAQSTGTAMIGFAKAFKRLNPDIVVVLGDRFETLAAATAALLMRIPIAHIHGGEVTEGAYDDAIRHSITKMANWHFVAHAEYKKRVIQLGENPKTVFNVGAPGLDCIKCLKLLTQKELSKLLKITIDKNTLLVTFHPVTTQKGEAKNQIKNLLKALEVFSYRYIFTMPNADAENKSIVQAVQSFIKKHHNRAVFYKSLGQLKYLSLLKYVGCMVGNSSSGIIEAPSFQLPVVNIGDRQDGRVKQKNVIGCEYGVTSIRRAIKKAVSSEFKRKCSKIKNAYGDGKASKKIVKTLKKISIDKVKKRFYDKV